MGVGNTLDWVKVCKSDRLYVETSCCYPFDVLIE